MAINQQILQNALSKKDVIRGQTGIIYDERMAEHRCLWDKNYPERPERFTRVLERCKELELIKRCRPIQPRTATLEEILLKHTQEHYNILKSSDGVTNEEHLEDLSKQYHGIFIHPTTFFLSTLATGSTIELVDSILLNKVQNGMAIIRPPGHHALKSEYMGYCFFNNVAIAAQHAIDNHNLKRILILDYDVHHGQATQRAFYNDPRVLYFSIHRYEYGAFWPNLRESDFDAIGEGDGKGYNFNVPLNKIGMTNADYLAIWQQLLLPVALEYQPELVIVSAGYDAAFGCPEGEMEVTPAAYAHLISPVLTLAQGRVAVVLEGGYCLESLAEGAALSLRTLLGDPCPQIEQVLEPSESIKDSILNCIIAHRPYWNSLQVHELYGKNELNNGQLQPELHQIVQEFLGEGLPIPQHPPHYTRECYPTQSEELLKTIANRLSTLKSVTNLASAKDRVCYGFNITEVLAERFDEYKLTNRLTTVPTRETTVGESKICAPHSLDKAVGTTLQVVENVLNGLHQHGLAQASLRQADTADNLVLAAKYAIQAHGLERILIVDWNIHHDDNVQKSFENTAEVLYVSLHRQDSNPSEGSVNFVGVGPGKGFTVNVPWNGLKMGDVEYIAAFLRVILPIAYEYNPELVLVSAGFGAVIGDPLDQYHVTPEAYGYFTHWLSTLANGKIVLFFNDGLTSRIASHALAQCAKALLGDPLPALQIHRKKPNVDSVDVIQKVQNVQSAFWKSLKFNKKLPDFFIGNL